ncbi:MAG: hypothetical protein ACREHD_16240, partial [Pirellulales bacterium]
LLDLAQLDEVHLFVAPRLLGGATAPSPIAGAGIEHLRDALSLHHPQWRLLDDDLYLTGRIGRAAGSREF